MLRLARLTNPMSTDPTAQRLAEAEQMAREIISIADDASQDHVAKQNSKNAEGQAPVREVIARAKLRIDVRMWLMARYAPQVFGGGALKTPDTDPAVSFEIHTTVDQEVTD